MEVDTQAVLDDILEQNKQLTLQLAVARVMISQLRQQLVDVQTPEESK